LTLVKAVCVHGLKEFSPQAIGITGRCCCYLHILFSIPSDWKRSLIVRIPKKDMLPTVITEEG
jgi:hypothetical protein